MNERTNKRMHFLAFFGRVLLMAYLPASLMRLNNAGTHELLYVWMAVVGAGALLMMVSVTHYYKDRRGDWRLMLLDTFYIISIFLLIGFLPFGAMTNAFIAETIALLILMAMNVLFVRRWPPVRRQR